MRYHSFFTCGVSYRHTQTNRTRNQTFQACSFCSDCSISAHRYSVHQPQAETQVYFGIRQSNLYHILSCCSYIAQAPHERSPASFDPVNTGHSLSSRYPSMQSRLSGSAGRKRGTHGRVCVKNMSLTPVPVVVHIWIMAVRLRRLMIKIQASSSHRAAAELGTAVSTQNMNKPSN